MRQLNVNLTELQQKYEKDIAERDKKIELLHTEGKEIVVSSFVEIKSINLLLYFSQIMMATY